jgi:hypothetical protein
MFSFFFYLLVTHKTRIVWGKDKDNTSCLKYAIQWWDKFKIWSDSTAVAKGPEKSKDTYMDLGWDLGGGGGSASRGGRGRGKN